MAVMNDVIDQVCHQEDLEEVKQCLDDVITGVECSESVSLRKLRSVVFDSSDSSSSDIESDVDSETSIDFRRYSSEDSSQESDIDSDSDSTDETDSIGETDGDHPYVIVDIKTLEACLNMVASCSLCRSQLKLVEIRSARIGLGTKLQFSCSRCPNTQSFNSTTKTGTYFSSPFFTK